MSEQTLAFVQGEAVGCALGDGDVDAPAPGVGEAVESGVAVGVTGGKPPKPGDELDEGSAVGVGETRVVSPPVSAPIVVLDEPCCFCPVTSAESSFPTAASTPVTTIKAATKAAPAATPTIAQFLPVRWGRAAAGGAAGSPAP